MAENLLEVHDLQVHFRTDGGVVRAVDGVLAGPKGTLLGGQTRSLGVVTTTLARSTAPGPLTPSACGTF